MEPEGDQVPGVTPGSALSQLPGWRLTLLVASSALLSGIAIVLWNRGALQRLRQASAGPPAGPPEGSEFL